MSLSELQVYPWIVTNLFTRFTVNVKKYRNSVHGLFLPSKHAYIYIDQTPQYAASDQGLHCLFNGNKKFLKVEKMNQTPIKWEME